MKNKTKIILELAYLNNDKTSYLSLLTRDLIATIVEILNPTKYIFTIFNPYRSIYSSIDININNFVVDFLNAKFLDDYLTFENQILHNHMRDMMIEFNKIANKSYSKKLDTTLIEEQIKVSWYTDREEITNQYRLLSKYYLDNIKLFIEILIKHNHSYRLEMKIKDRDLL